VDEQESRWRAERGYDARYDEGAGYPDGYGVPQPRGRSGGAHGGDTGRQDIGRHDTGRHQVEPARHPSPHPGGPPPPTRGGTVPATGPSTRDPLFSAEEAARFRAIAEEPMPMAPPMGQPAVGRRPERSPSDSVYRARRPAAIALIAGVAIVVGLLLVRALAVSAFGKVFQPGGVLGSSLALSALPLVAVGLYGLVTGAAHHAEQVGFRVWARPPLAYLWVGLALLVAAGLAIS